MSLKPQQERFCQEYLIDLNATAAYKRAGYEPKNDNVAAAAASRLLGTVKIQARVAELQHARSQRVHITQDQVLQELAVLAFSDVGDYEINDLGNVECSEGAKVWVTRALSSVKRTVRRDEDRVEYVTTEFRLWDKPAALRMLGQHLGMFKEIHELTGKDGEAIPIEIRDAQQTLRRRIGRLADRLTAGSELTAARPYGNGRRASPR
ncbi:MAG TPA: terminase small subunit [Candidatus Omnitrophica bacterium]|nr:terminase small subunit [Candidatus Omnitrophota bacterium]